MYHIRQIKNGNMSRLHRHISTYDQAYDILKSMHVEIKKSYKNAKLFKWSVIGKGIIYQIANDALESRR